MLIESPVLWYSTRLLFAHVVWWSTAVWTATTTRWRRPERSLTMGCITSVFQDVKCCGDGGWHEGFYTLNMSDNIKYRWVGGQPHRDGEDNQEEKTMEVADIRMYHFGWNFLQKGFDMTSQWWWLIRKLFILWTCLTTLKSCMLVVDDTVDGKDN